MNRETAWTRLLKEMAGFALPLAPAPETVLNGSFEEGEGSIPEDWHLAAGGLGVSTMWQTEGGVDGGRCLWISPKGGGASWYCRPIPISPGVEYVFSCAVKRKGNRHWAHACEISWIALVFLDAAGRPVRENPNNDQPLVQVRCRQTADWVEGWRCLVAPSQARSLQIGFRLVRGEPDLHDAHGFRRFWHGDIDTGEWWVDDVRIERMAVKVETSGGRLAIHVPQGVARLRIVDDAGHTFQPRGAFAYTHGGGCFHALREDVALGLPAGAYTVQAMRGFQRRPFTQRIEVQPGQDARIHVEMSRLVDWPRQGWYTGDHHNHLSFHGSTRYPLMTIDDVCRVAQGEGLDFLSFCGEIVDQHAYADWRDAGRPADAKPDGAYETTDFLCTVSHEVTQDLLGHVCLVNAPGHIAPGHPWWLAPTNAELVEGLRGRDSCATEGAVVMAHPYSGVTAENLFDVLADPSVTCLQRELPVDAALGYAHTMDFLAVEEPADLDLRFRDYFRLLDLGLRIGVSGASDAYADQGTEIVGSLCTVVKAEAFTLDAIAKAYRAQRTLTTNGPLLMFGANAACPGDTVTGPGLRLDAKAFSNWGLSRLEIILNGDVVADATPGPDGWARIQLETKAARSGWLVARCWGPGHCALNMQSTPEAQHAKQGQWAVTSPIYIVAPGKPIVPQREDVEYFLRWIDASCHAIRGRKAVLEGQGPFGPAMKDEHVQAALDLFQRARRVYEKML